MTIDDFQNETNDYMTRNEAEAKAKAAAYNAKGVDGETIVVAKFDEHYCLMLSGAYEFVKGLGI